MMSWHSWIQSKIDDGPLKETLEAVAQERQQGEVIFPPKELVFNAFDLTDFQNTKVVILGQDPYHGPNQAHGLSFSVPVGEKIPPSLRNIYKELSSDIDRFETPNHGCLVSWAEQGVLLLNTVLTVRQGLAHSHKTLGWEGFTDSVIKRISDELTGVIFLLWGAPAQKKQALIDEDKHHILKAPHPSPLSAHRGFFGCGHFSMTNHILEKQSKQPIDWSLDSVVSNQQASLW
jgi:uracil-DNA glycosylase